MVVFNTTWSDDYLSGPQFIVNVSTPSCTAMNVAINGSTGVASNSENYTATDSYGFGRIVDCAGAPSVQQILISVGMIQYKLLFNGTEERPGVLILPLNEAYQITEALNLLCVPDHTIQQRLVTKEGNSTTQKLTVGAAEVSSSGSARLQNVRPLDIALGVFTSVTNSQELYQQTYNFPTNSDTFFNILAQQHIVTDGSVASPFWMNQQNLENLSSDLYGSIAAQVAAQELLLPTHESFLGTASTNEDRLFVRVLSFALMEAGLALIVIANLFLFLLPNTHIIVRDPGTLAGIAAVIAASPELTDRIPDSTATGPLLVKSAQETSTFQTESDSTTSANCRIRTVPASRGSHQGKENRGRNIVRWWQPLVLRRGSRLLVVLIPLVYVVVLEILYQVSLKNDGLAHVDTSTWAHYTWTYLPALLMVGVHLLFSSIDFNIKVFSPYSALHKSAVSSTTSVLDHPLARIALHQLWISGIRLQFAVFTSTLSVLLAPLLTIVVSGLYIPQTYSQPLTITQLTAWNFGASDTPPNTTLVDIAYSQLNASNPSGFEINHANSTSVTVDLIVEGNVSYPAWTYDEISIPLIKIAKFSPRYGGGIGPSTGSFLARVPTARAALNCTIIPESNVNVTYTTSKTIALSSIDLETTYSSNGGFGQRGNASDWPVALFSTINYNLGCDPPNALVYLQPSDPRRNVSNPRTFGWFTYPYTDLQSPNASCPTMAGMFGSATFTRVIEYTWFVCSTNVERVMADVTFELPDYAISTTQTPRILEDTTALVHGYEFHPFTSYANFSGPDCAVDLATYPDEYLSFYNNSETQSFDNFFSALVYARDGVPPKELLGKANSSRLLSAVQHLYRVIMVHVIMADDGWVSADARDLHAWSPHLPLNGTLMDPNALRLKQSAISTRILEGLLAGLSLCAMVTFYLMDTRRLLPNNPSNITAVASLLKGSDMLDVIRREGRQPGQHESWDGYFFSLGWWGSGSSRRYGIDIGKAEKTS